MTSSDRFRVPVRSAVKSNLTDWCFQNLSKRALNAPSSTVELVDDTYTTVDESVNRISNFFTSICYVFLYNLLRQLTTFWLTYSGSRGPSAVAELRVLETCRPTFGVDSSKTPSHRRAIMLPPAWIKLSRHRSRPAISSRPHGNSTRNSVVQIPPWLEY